MRSCGVPALALFACALGLLLLAAAASLILAEDGGPAPPPKKGASAPEWPEAPEEAGGDTLPPPAEPAEPPAEISLKPGVPLDSLLLSVAPAMDPFGTWTRSTPAFSFYAPRSLGDVAAALPIGRADRFGPPGYFETIRIGGTGAPLVLVDGIPWPRDAAGLPNAGSLPRQGIGSHAAAAPRIVPELGVASPGGAILLGQDPWLGGPPRSVVAAESGADGYRDYRFGLGRDLTRRLAVQVDGQFRKADAFVVDSYRAFSSCIVAEALLRPGMVLRAGVRRYDAEQYVLDRTLQGRFSHEATDKKGTTSAEIIVPGMIGQAYLASLHSDADATGAAYGSASAVDERSGFRLSRAGGLGPAGLALTVRGEKREAEADGVRREAWTGTVSAGTSFAPVPWGEAAVALLGEKPEGEEGADARGRVVRVERAGPGPRSRGAGVGRPRGPEVDFERGEPRRLSLRRGGSPLSLRSLASETSIF
ncbi:MAG: hypothetical protein ABIH26_09885 [Candidatus Eisenbacteria bacterium]